MMSIQTTGPHPILEEAADPDPLQAYTKNKLALAARLRRLRERIVHSGKESSLRECDELLVKLAEDRFTLAIVGQFKRGKSSLMNAIIGRPLLPVGILPLTSVITVLKYGAQERLLIVRDDVALSLAVEEPMARLEEFVSAKLNHGNWKHVKTASVEVPSPFLRRGLELVDTPGIGSAIEANTATTLNFLPQCDAVLFVTGVESPLTSAELGFLEQVRRHVRKVFFVVNKIDLVAAAQRQEVLEFVARTIEKQMAGESVTVFPVSAQLGLEGKEDDSQQSGLPNLQRELARFLSEDRASTFFSSINSRLTALETRLPAQPEVADDPVSSRGHDFAADLRTRGCPACNHLTAFLFRFFSHLQYAVACRESAQQELANTNGFCPLHLWQLEGLSSAAGMSTGFAAWTQRTAQLLAARARSPRPRAPLNLVRGSAECHVCRLLQEEVQNYLVKLSAFLNSSEAQLLYAKSQGVCLRHLKGLLHALADDAIARLILSDAAKRFEEFSEDMQSYGLKVDALRRKFHNGDEKDAYLRALVHLAGAKGLCHPP